MKLANKIFFSHLAIIIAIIASYVAIPSLQYYSHHLSMLGCQLLPLCMQMIGSVKYLLPSV